MIEHRARQSQEAHEAYNEQQRLRRRQVRAQEIHEAREQRLAAQRQRQQQQQLRRKVRAQEMHEAREQRLAAQRQRRQKERLPPSNIERAAFRYEPDIEYGAHASVRFGSMSVVCPHCDALKFPKEPAGLCCASGKVKLPELLPPPEPLRSLLYGESPNSNHFLQNSKMYNDCFQMTSFGGEIARNVA